MATGFVNGRGQFLTPHRIHTSWPITKKLVASGYVGDPYEYAKFGANPSMGGFWANGWNMTKNYLFLYTFSRELTYRPGPSTDFHAWWFKWCELVQGCAFWGFAILLPILGVQYPQNPIFGGMNRRFQAKRAKYWKLHVIETTASISTKFCTMSGHRGWSQSCPVNPKWQTATILKKKPLNCHISATIWWILMKFGRMTHIVPIQWIYH